MSVRGAAAALALVAVLLAGLPAGAQGYAVGFSEQQPSMFSNPLFQKLRVGYARVIVSWDVAQRRSEADELDAWLTAAQAAGVQPLVSFNHSRNCFAQTCRLPSVAQYTHAFRRFHQRWPEVKTISPWNEVNHFSQPTYRNPRRAASYYNVVRAYCRGCRIVAADVLDQAGVGRYLREFERYARGTPRIWGLHNYSDTNRFRATGTREVMRAVKGQIWLTETGGVVHFGRAFPFSPTRAARATRYMFRLAASNRRISRLYIYQWTGARRTARFDAGLLDVHGRPRPAYFVVRHELAQLTGSR